MKFTFSELKTGTWPRTKLLNGHVVLLGCNGREIVHRIVGSVGHVDAKVSNFWSRRVMPLFGRCKGRRRRGKPADMSWLKEEFKHPRQNKRSKDNRSNGSKPKAKRRRKRTSGASAAKVERYHGYMCMCVCV